MKNLILLLAMVFTSLGASAQNQQNNITVNGTHEYTLTPEYTSKMTVSLTNVYYDAQTISFAEVKSGYLDKLSKAGINSDRITENDLSYALLGYDKEGTVFEFKTKSIEEMKKFLDVRSIGVLRTDTLLESEISDDEMAEYSKYAFENAKKKAEAIAQKVNRKIGKAIYITDTNAQELSESMYHSTIKDTRQYQISVSFELL